MIQSLIYGAIVGISLLHFFTGISAAGKPHDTISTEERCNEGPLLVAQTEGTVPPSSQSGSSDIQERAIPRMAPGTAPMGTRQEFQGAVFENNRLRVKPGYVFEYLPGNKVIAKRAGGGGGGTWDVKCGACTKKGKCEMVRSPEAVYCLGECTGSCNIIISPTGGKLLIQ